LESLETQICIRSAQKSDLERVHQLFTKTNQFNVTTIRYSIGDVEKFFSDEHYDLTVFSAKDRFGDLGIIGLYLLALKDEQVDIDSFILSCRAMGRGIENAVMNRIKQRYVLANKGSKLIAKYIPTKKNVPVRSFFEEQGFIAIHELGNGEKEYILSGKNCSLMGCSWIKINE
jgi:FkbH-like protein